ncbi:MAG: ATP cone domain-containing protein [Candidatus Micrarchaeota archaeon]
MPILVKKGDGTLEPLDYNKVKRALRRAGVGRALREEVIDSLQEEVYENISTEKIYKLAFSQLRKLKPGAAARFSLKSALLRLGPNGYPFETFMGSLLKGRGYETELRQIVRGKCVAHEIDVIVKRMKMEGHAKTKSIVECKFHNSPHLKCRIQSALYSWARFLDIREKDRSFDSCWLATNTKFTSDVVQYGDCVGLKLLGWSFPKNESIQIRIDENKLYPITVIPKLKRRTFNLLHNAGIILVKELADAPDNELRKAGLGEWEIGKLKEKCVQIISNKK